MTIEWGGWDYGSGNGMRVGIEYEVTSPSNSSSSCTFTYDIWTENQYSYNDNGQKLSYSDDIGGSTTFNNNSGGSPVKRATKTYTYTYSSSSYGSSPGTSTATVKLSGTYNGVTPSRSITHTIPTRPYATPAAPSGCKAVRASDTNIAVSWTRNATSGKPYDALWLERYTYGHQGWTRIATMSGGATSYPDTTAAANRVYAYRVQADNSVGTSGFSQSGDVWTTPAAPTSPVRTQSGTDQVLTWAQDIGYTQYETEVWRAVNGVYALLTTVATGLRTYTDTTSSAATKVKYKFRTKTTSGTALYSAYSADTTETVGVLTPPSAPTLLVPSGVVLDPTDPIQHTWKHNPTDATAQSAFQVQYRYVGDSTWIQTGKLTSTASSWTMPAGTRAKGRQVEWQVQTWGGSATASPFSATATWTTSPIIPLKYPLVLDLTSGRSEALSKGLAAWDVDVPDRPDLQNLGPDLTFGQPIYLDNLGALRAQPIVIPGGGVSGLTSASLTSAYPMGVSLLSVYAADVAPGNWPGVGVVMTMRRAGDASEATSQAFQWLYQSSLNNTPVLYRAASPGWSTWRNVVEDTGWANLTPLSGSGTFQWRCVNGTVSVRVNLSGLTSLAVGATVSMLNAGVLPAAYCPGLAVYSQGNGGGALATHWNVNPSGSMSLMNSSTAAVNVARTTATWLKE